MNPKVKSFLKILLFLAIGLSLVWMSFKDLSGNDINKLKTSALNANYWWLLLSVLIGVLSHVLRAYRWKMLAEPMGYNPRFSNSFFAVTVGYLVNYGVPRLGEISRCTVLNKYEKIPFTKSFGTVIAERVLDLIFFFIVFLLMLITQYEKISGYLQENIYPAFHAKTNKLAENTTALLLLAGSFILLILFLFLFRKKIKGIFSDKVKNFIKGFSEGLLSVKNVKNPLNFIFQTALIWFSYYLSMHVCFYCIPECADLGFGVGITAFVFGSITVMITPGGIGAYPYALQKILFLVYGINEAVGASFGWISWSASFLAIIVTGVLSFILLPVLNKNYHPVLPETEKSPA